MVLDINVRVFICPLHLLFLLYFSVASHRCCFEQHICFHWENSRLDNFTSYNWMFVFATQTHNKQTKNPENVLSNRVAFQVDNIINLLTHGFFLLLLWFDIKFRNEISTNLFDFNHLKLTAIIIDPFPWSAHKHSSFFSRLSIVNWFEINYDTWWVDHRFFIVWLFSLLIYRWFWVVFWEVSTVLMQNFL